MLDFLRDRLIAHTPLRLTYLGRRCRLEANKIGQLAGKTRRGAKRSRASGTASNLIAGAGKSREA